MLVAKYKSWLHEACDEVTKSDGVLSKFFDKYSPRKAQLDVIDVINDAYIETLNNIVEGNGKIKHAIIEAGTGTGKSFALTIPLLLLLTRQNAARKPGERQKKGLIVTATTTLQSQLYKKDLPLIQKVLNHMGYSFKSALYKGKGNYICTQRFMKFLNGNMSPAERSEMSKILPGITDGKNNLDLEKCDKEMMPVRPSDEFWEKINIGMESSCYGCPYKENGCYYHSIRTNSQDADIYVGNHAMLMQDLKMRLKTGKGTLPEYDYVVIDEAHHVEMGLAEDFSSKIEITALWGIGKTIEWILTLPNLKEARAIVIRNSYNEFKKEVLKVFDFFKKQCKGESIPWSHQVRPTRIDLDTASSILLTEVARILMNTTKPGDKNRLNSVTNRILALIKDLKAFAYNEADSDYFFNIKLDRATGNVSLLMTPLNGGELMNKVLFSRVPVIISSATIKVGENLDVFGQKIGNLEPDEFNQLCVDSPFDYKKNSIFYIPADAKGAKEPGYDEYCYEEMKKLVDLSRGRAFLLFTSKTTLDQYYRVLAPYFKSKGYQCFKQGEADRNTLINQFKKSTNGILFGGDSFWEGVDVPGRILCNVIMQKLPFNTPDPISQAKEALVKAAGRDAFVECQVFPAIIKFKQGVGRLIRDKDDGGIITLLDGRVFISKNFGKYFVNAVPKEMGKTVEFEDLAPFVAE